MELSWLFKEWRHHVTAKRHGSVMTFMQRIEKVMLPAPHTGKMIGNIRLQAGEADLDAFYIPPETTDGVVVLLSHGNGEYLEICDFWSQCFRKHGYGLLVYDYAGYGGSTGEPSERQMELDGEAAYDFLTTNLHIAPRKIVVMGYSMGSVPSCHIAANRVIRLLVLCAPVASGWRLCLPLGFGNDIFRNTERVAKCQCPLLIFHGTCDRIVPFWNGKTLFRKAGCKHKHFVPVKGAGHNDLFFWLGEDFWKCLNSFLLAET